MPPDPYAEFGGSTKQDPYAEFGGGVGVAPAKPKKATAAAGDPYAEFGGGVGAQSTRGLKPVVAPQSQADADLSANDKRQGLSPAAATAAIDKARELPKLPGATPQPVSLVPGVAKPGHPSTEERQVTERHEQLHGAPLKPVEHPLGVGLPSQKTFEPTTPEAIKIAPAAMPPTPKELRFAATEGAIGRPLVADAGPADVIDHRQRGIL